MKNISPVLCRMFAHIPEDLREKILDLHEDIDVLGTKFTLAPHGRGKAWRIRWLQGRRQRSLSVGSQPKVIEAIKAMLEDWRTGGYTFLHFHFDGRSEIPPHYLGKIRAGISQRESERNYWHERMLDNPPPAPPVNARKLSQTEKEEFRHLPAALFKELLQLKRQINVLAVNFIVVHRPDRKVWVLRWRESNQHGQIVQRSLNLGGKERVVDLVRKLLEAWRNWECPLLDLLFPEKVVPPEYWGLDWFYRIARAFPESRISGNICAAGPAAITGAGSRGGFPLPQAHAGAPLHNPATVPFYLRDKVSAIRSVIFAKQEQPA